MGLLSSLALAIIPLLKRPNELEPTPTEDRLRREIESLHKEIETVSAECDQWAALANRWRARYEQAINPVLEREIAAQIRYQAALNQAAAQVHSAQMNAQMNAQSALGQQNFEGFCNCVPARHDALVGSIIRVEGLP